MINQQHHVCDWGESISALWGSTLLVEIMARLLRQVGAVQRADECGLLVGATGGVVLLGDVQLEGKKRMSARDFLLGHPISPGTLLGRK